MKYTLVTAGDHAYIEMLPDGSLLQSESDALDLVAACGGNGVDCLLLHAESLPEEFFRLSTGLAGAILLKLSNYHVRCAILITPELEGNGRFHEMVLEANRRNPELHFFYERPAAEQWLANP
jgi:PadR family transcriptional regulator AphA